MNTKQTNREEKQMWTIIGPNFEELVSGDIGRAIAVALECAKLIGLARVFTSNGVEVIRFRGTIGRELGIRPTA